MHSNLKRLKYIIAYFVNKKNVKINIFLKRFKNFP